MSAVEIDFQARTDAVRRVLFENTRGARGGVAVFPMTVHEIAQRLGRGFGSRKLLDAALKRLEKDKLAAKVGASWVAVAQEQAPRDARLGPGLVIAEAPEKGMQLVIEITGDRWSDLEVALDEVKRRIGEEYTSGHESNSSGSYSFNVSGEPVKEDETDEADEDEAERFLAAGCYYSDPKTCRGELWQCETCREKYCAVHNHSTSKGDNVECVACERTRKEAEEAKDGEG